MPLPIIDKKTDIFTHKDGFKTGFLGVFCMPEKPPFYGQISSSFQNTESVKAPAN